ncbi:MAG: dynamin family protein [Pseudomonadota bacterium]
MNMAFAAEEAAGAEHAANEHTIPTGFEPFERIAEDVEELEDLLLDLSSLCDTEPAKALRKLQVQLKSIVPSVTMIGQVKAGKTSLVNAMIGRPEFLPADVNPWTSVVTSLHLNTPRAKDAPLASFQLFKPEEWDNLVQSGGRLGELARNADADEELQRVNSQILEMREKTRARLGRKFELLLGQRHDFDRIDEDLIQSYVCMGDDPAIALPEDGGAAAQGRFADITKSADIYLDAPHIPTALCLRDTPGVNDTFLMREQITIGALRSSRLCVVVLSAHQALTTTDLAMIRMISNVKSRDLVIFVNRIDELPEPETQIDEIRDSIRATLAEHKGPADAEIVFGSAYWANLAVRSATDALDDAAFEALELYGALTLGEAAEQLGTDDLAWAASGVPALFNALGERLAKGAVEGTLRSVRQQGQNIAQGLMVSTALVSVQLIGDAAAKIDQAVVGARVEEIGARARRDLMDKLDALEHDFGQRVDRVRMRFLDRALETLLQHLDTKGDAAVWNYSADGLRMLLRSSFLVLSKNYAQACQAVYEEAAEGFAATYQTAFQVTAKGFTIAPPDAPKVPPPVTLGATIALDLNTSWWRSLWHRRGSEGRAAHYRKMLEAETAPLLEQLNANHVATIREAAIDTLNAFLDTQSAQLMDIGSKSARTEEDMRSAFGISQAQDRIEMLRSLIDDFLEMEEDLA